MLFGIFAGLNHHHLSLELFQSFFLNVLEQQLTQQTAHTGVTNYIQGSSPSSIVYTIPSCVASFRSLARGSSRWRAWNSSSQGPHKYTAIHRSVPLKRIWELAEHLLLVKNKKDHIRWLGEAEKCSYQKLYPYLGCTHRKGPHEMGPSQRDEGWCLTSGTLGSLDLPWRRTPKYQT